MATRLTAVANIAILLFAAGILLFAMPLRAAPAHTVKAACQRVKAQFAAQNRLAERSFVAFCDPLDPDAGRKGFYVIALRSNRHCDGICSTLMGWYAVQKRNGRVFDWDVANMKLGKPLN